jgi:D-alanyl-D-alanine-carboxypeptidase/D-alanyl-D-alanine-endopeptidase
MTAMLSFLQTRSPPVGPADTYSYSNLAFAIMSAILALDGLKGPPTIETFVGKMRKNIFEPLGLGAKFFDEVSVVDLPVGYNYDKRFLGYRAVQHGHPLFPAIFGAAGIVATPSDMLKWLLFNMGITTDKRLTPLLRMLHTPSTSATAEGGEQLGLGWFIGPANVDGPGLVNKDGDLDGFGAYMGFVQSTNPGAEPSRAGAFVLVNAHDLTEKDLNGDVQIAEVLTKKVLRIMQGVE